MKTLLKYFFDAVRARPDAPMLRPLDGPPWTYAEVAQRVAAAAEHLTLSGLAEGDRLIAYADQTVPLTLLYLACSQAGVLLCPVSPVFSTRYLIEVARQAGANAVATTTNNVGPMYEVGLPIFHFNDGKRQVDRTPAAGLDVSRGVLWGDRLQRLFNHELPLDHALALLEKGAESRQVEDSFLVQLTSGSTGQPKLVLRMYSAFSRYAQFVGDEILKLTEGAPFEMLAVNALTHAFAGHMFTVAMRLGATICIAPGLDAATKLEHVRELDPDVLPMTPRVLRSFVLQARSDQPRRSDDSTELPHLFGNRAKLLVSAGGKGDVATFQALRNEGVEVMEFYGSSEASLMALTPYKGWRPDHAGVPVADVQMKLARDGEILVQSPGLFLGYLGDTDLTSLVFDDDFFFRTGDIGQINEGYLCILGRKRDTFNTPEGTNIFPERIEIRLESMPMIKQAMLVGDGKPYITAHLTIRNAPSCKVTEDGVVSEEEVDLYQRIAADIAVLNDSLEHIERILAFNLYVSDFDTKTYRSVSAGKVVRDRRQFLAVYGVQAERLYSRTLSRESPQLVAPGERRYVDRVRTNIRR